MLLYVGVTNDLVRRLGEHEQGVSTFTAKYNCFYLVYWEFHQYVNNAIEREKEITGDAPKKRPLSMISTQIGSF